MKREPTSHDIYVGERIRDARIAADMTQRELAGMIGTSFQQLQKYENGSNRVPSARLTLLVTILRKPLNYFFPNVIDTFLAEAQQVGHKWSCIPSDKARRAVVDLIDELTSK